MLELKQDMWKFAKAKTKALEEKKKSLEKNYLRIEANMEDQKDHYKKSRSESAQNQLFSAGFKRFGKTTSK